MLRKGFFFYLVDIDMDNIHSMDSSILSYVLEVLGEGHCIHYTPAILMLYCYHILHVRLTL